MNIVIYLDHRYYGDNRLLMAQDLRHMADILENEANKHTKTFKVVGPNYESAMGLYFEDD